MVNNIFLKLIDLLKEKGNTDTEDEIEPPCDPNIINKLNTIRRFYNWIEDNKNLLSQYVICMAFPISIDDDKNEKDIEPTIYNWLLLICAEILVYILQNRTGCIERVESILSKECSIRDLYVGITIYPIYRISYWRSPILKVTKWRTLSVNDDVTSKYTFIPWMQDHLIRWYNELVIVMR